MKRDRGQCMVCRDGKLLLIEHRMRGRDFFNLPGGRGSGKSSFCALEIVLQIMQDKTGAYIHGFDYSAKGNSGDRIQK